MCTSFRFILPLTLPLSGIAYVIMECFMYKLKTRVLFTLWTSTTSPPPCHQDRRWKAAWETSFRFVVVWSTAAGSLTTSRRVGELGASCVNPPRLIVLMSPCDHVVVVIIKKTTNSRLIIIQQVRRVSCNTRWMSEGCARLVLILWQKSLTEEWITLTHSNIKKKVKKYCKLIPPPDAVWWWTKNYYSTRRASLLLQYGISMHFSYEISLTRQGQTGVTPSSFKPRSSVHVDTTVRLQAAFPMITNKHQQVALLHK